MRVRNPRFAIVETVDLPEPSDDLIVKQVAKELAQASSSRSFRFLAVVAQMLLESKRDLTLRGAHPLLAVRLLEAIVEISHHPRHDVDESPARRDCVSDTGVVQGAR